VLGKPVDVVADDMAADFDAAVVGVGGLEGLQFLGRRIVEIERWPAWSEQRFGPDRWLPNRSSASIAVAGNRVGLA
jgi:hypothetical protein